MFSNLSFIFLLQLLLPVWSSVSLIPPSTFPSASTSSQISSISSGSSTSSTSSSRSSSSSASATSTSFPTLSTYTSCVTNCLAIAIARVNCTSVVEVNCFCVQPQFPAELVGCINSGCPDQLATVENLAQQFCNIASTSTSLSFSPTSFVSSSATSVSSSSSSTSTAPSTSPPSTTSGALILGISGQGTVLGFMMSILGAILGTYALW